MQSISQIENVLAAGPLKGMPEKIAAEYLALAEQALILYLHAKNIKPGDDEKEGFRLLALQRQGCKGDPSFNACRETAREIAYHYNLLTMQKDHSDTDKRIDMMHMVTKHLVLFITNKMMDEKTGEFCCSSRVNRLNRNELLETGGING